MSRFSAKRCLWPYAETITATAEHGTACTSSLGILAKCFTG